MRGPMTLSTSRASDWEATFDAISDGVLLLDDGGRIVRLNRAAETILAVARGDAEGCRLRDVLDLPDLDDPELLTSPARTRLEATTGTRWLRLTFDPVTTATGERDG